MDSRDRALALLPAALRSAADGACAEGAEELRLRLGRAVGVCVQGHERPLDGPPVTAADIRAVLERASCASFQSVESQLRQGYIMAPGGVRVGLCGTAVMQEGCPVGLRDFTSLCIRIPHEVRGCADGVYPFLSAPRFVSTLICSPPGAGKTTLLRELVRRLSDDGYCVAVADERGELGGAAGPEGFDLGAHTDVMTALPKAQAVMQLTRTMSPQIVAMDEITDERDALSLLAAAGCGTALLASVHAAGVEDLRRRPALRRLLAAGVFEKRVVIARLGAQRRYEAAAL